MAAPIPFVHDTDVAYGRAIEVSPLIRRIVARNPGPFTYTGTGTYIVGRGRVAVIDPGPDDPDHIAALTEALRGETVTHILVTHTHRDHSPGAAALKQAVGAATHGHGPHATPPADHGVAIEEGVDHGFAPDESLRHGDTVTGPGWTLEAVHTPGHTANHMCFALREEAALLTGDHVMGWSTTVVAPLDGDMGHYMDSLRLVMARAPKTLWPTHGAPVRNVAPFLKAFLQHRLDREAEVAAALAAGLTRIGDIVARLYRGLDPRLHGAAALSVHAHLLHLINTRQAASDAPGDMQADFYPRS